MTPAKFTPQTEPYDAPIRPLPSVTAPLMLAVAAAEYFKLHGKMPDWAK